MREKEELRLCRDFGELRAGMLVVATCEICGPGRGMLRSMVQCLLLNWVRGSAWTMDPNCTCGTKVGPNTVAFGLVMIVETGNDDEAERAQGKLDESIRDSRRVRYEDVK